MKPQAGFTFTELLTIVTIMVMLAAVAVPRYAKVNSDSRSMSVRSLEANVRNSANLAHKVWRASGQPLRLNVDGSSVEMRNGYPTVGSIADIVVMGDEFRYADGYWHHRQSDTDEGCSVLYMPPQSSKTDAIVLSYTDGC